MSNLALIPGDTLAAFDAAVVAGWTATAIDWTALRGGAAFDAVGAEHVRPVVVPFVARQIAYSSGAPGAREALTDRGGLFALQVFVPANVPNSALRSAALVGAALAIFGRRDNLGTPDASGRRPLRTMTGSHKALGRWGTFLQANAEFPYERKEVA